MVRTPVDVRNEERAPITPAPDSSVPEIVSTKKIFFLNSFSGSRRSEIPHVVTAEYCPRDQVSRRLFHNNSSCDCDCQSDGCLGCLRRNRQCCCRFGVLALGILVIILLFGSLSYNLTRSSDENSFEFELKNEWNSHRHYYNISEYNTKVTEDSKNESHKETELNLPVQVVEIPDDYDFGGDSQKHQYSVVEFGHNKDHDEFEPLFYSPLNTQKLNSRNPTLIINDGREPHRQKRFISSENKKKESDLVNFLNEKNYNKKVSKKRNYAFMKEFFNSQENIDSYRENFLKKAHPVFEPFSLATPLNISPLQSDEYSFEDNDIEEKLKDKFLNEDFPIWETEKPKESAQKTTLNVNPTTESWEEETENWTETTEYNPVGKHGEENVIYELMGLTTGERKEAWAARNGDNTDFYITSDENVTYTTDRTDTIKIFVTDDYERLSHITEKVLDTVVVTSEQNKSINSEVHKGEDEEDSGSIVQKNNSVLEGNGTQFRTFSNIPLIQVALPFIELFGAGPKDEISSTSDQTDKVKGISLLEAKDRKMERRKNLLLNSRVVGGSSDVRLPTGPDISKPFVNAFETLKTNQQLSFTPSAASQYILPYQMCFFANPVQGSKPSFHGAQPRTFPVRSPLLSLLDKDTAPKQSYPTQQNFLSFSINNYAHPPPSPYRQQNVPYGSSYFTFPSQPQSPFLNGQGFNKQPIFCTYLQPPLFQFPTVPGTADFSHARCADCDDGSKIAPFSREKFFPTGRDTMCTDESIPCRDRSSCVPIDNWCDNQVHCKDASDEAFCSCRERVTRERLCDGYVDCPQGEDEVGCFDCPKTAFSCDSVTSPESCIPLSKRCDGVRDCSAGADETECSALFFDMRQNNSFHVPQTKGFLHRNWKGDWFPVCVEVADDTWAREACAAELGVLSQLAEVSFAPVPGHFKGPFIVRRRDGTPTLQDHCKGHVSTYVTCSSIKCGSRVEFPSLREFDSRFRRFIQNDIEVGNVPFVKWWNNLRKNSSGELSASKIRESLNLEQAGVRLKRGETGRVVGGKESEPRAWPWAIAVYKDGAFHCGGVILDEKWVLTAAHCMEQYWNHFYEVRGGMLRRFSFSAMEQPRTVTHVIIHENYNPNIMSSDIAVLRLSEPFSFNRWVRPACLPSLEEGFSKFLWGPMPGSTCIAVGWGALRERGSDPDQLREVEVPILSRCKHKEDVAGAEICAGKFEGGKDTCQGDSGGPLLCRDSDIPPSWYVAGIVSHGEGCARPGEPGAYTRISLFVDWIAANTNDLQLPAIKPLKACPGFRCRSGSRLCIPIKWVCNGFTDCLEAEDEKNCNSSFMKSDLFRFSKEGNVKPEGIKGRSETKEDILVMTEKNINKSEEELTETTEILTEKAVEEEVLINRKDNLQGTVKTEFSKYTKELSTEPFSQTIENKKRPVSVTLETLSIEETSTINVQRQTLSNTEQSRPILTPTEEINFHSVNTEQPTASGRSKTTRENKFVVLQSTEGLRIVNTNFDATENGKENIISSESYPTVPQLPSTSYEKLNVTADSVSFTSFRPPTNFKNDEESKTANYFFEKVKYNKDLPSKAEAAISESDEESETTVPFTEEAKYNEDFIYTNYIPEITSLKSDETTKIIDSNFITTKYNSEKLTTTNPKPEVMNAENDEDYKSSIQSFERSNDYEEKTEKYSRTSQVKENLNQDTSEKMFSGTTEKMEEHTEVENMLEEVKEVEFFGRNRESTADNYSSTKEGLKNKESVTVSEEESTTPNELFEFKINEKPRNGEVGISTTSFSTDKEDNILTSTEYSKTTEVMLNIPKRIEEISVKEDVKGSNNRMSNFQTETPSEIERTTQTKKEKTSSGLFNQALFIESEKSEKVTPTVATISTPTDKHKNMEYSLEVALTTESEDEMKISKAEQEKYTTDQSNEKREVSDLTTYYIEDMETGSVTESLFDGIDLGERKKEEHDEHVMVEMEGEASEESSTVDSVSEYVDKKAAELEYEEFVDGIGTKEGTTKKYDYDDVVTEEPKEDFTEKIEINTGEAVDENRAKEATTEEYYDYDSIVTEELREEFVKELEVATDFERKGENATEFVGKAVTTEETPEEFDYGNIMSEEPIDKVEEKEGITEEYYYGNVITEGSTEKFVSDIGAKKKATERYYYDVVAAEEPTEEYLEENEITTNEVGFSSKTSNKKTTRETFGTTVQELFLESRENVETTTFPTYGTDFSSKDFYESSTLSVTEGSETENFTETSSKNPVLQGRAKVKSVYFQCQKIVQSILINYRCDGMFDCEDGTDEENCSCAETLVYKSPQLICDGRVDCADFSDEKNCSKCLESEFYCKISDTCIPSRERCNGVVKCQHGEDEEKCFALSKTRRARVQLNGEPVFQTKGLLVTNREGDWSVECQEGGSIFGAKEAIEVCDELGTIGYDRYQNRTLGFNCTAFEVTCSEKLTSSLENYRFSDRGYIWPWNAFVYADGVQICSAVLLKPEWLLTSTKCTEKTQIENNYITARFGSKSSLSKRPDTGLETVRIDAIEKVPNSDMALLHLSKEVNQSHYLRPIGIPYVFDSDPDKDVCVAVGDRTIFLNVLEDCDGRERCYRKVGSTSLTCKSKPWTGVIVCQSRFGWYPSSVYHEESGHCGFKDGVYSNVQKKIGAISSLLDKKVTTHPEPFCAGFRCSEGLCISQEKVCDGKLDCYSKEDESFHICGKQIGERGCKITELNCGNGVCVEKSLFADGIDDCGDNTDEPANVTCLEYLQVTAPQRICDGRRNCFDKTDEDPKLCSCDDFKFECKNGGGCIPRDYVCDGEKDCPLGEDEEHCIGRKTIKSYKKSHLELMEKSYGVWHTICPPQLSKENSDILCQHLGYKEALFTYERNQTVLSPKIDSFSWVKLNRKTSIALRGDKPFVKLVKLRKICTAVKCA